MIPTQKQSPQCTVGRDIDKPLLTVRFACSEQSLEPYSDSPSETSSPFSPSERRESKDSQDNLHNNAEGRRRKREGKDEKLAREEGITEYISVYDIINLPMGKLSMVWCISFDKCHPQTSSMIDWISTSPSHQE